MLLKGATAGRDLGRSAVNQHLEGAKPLGPLGQTGHATHTGGTRGNATFNPRRRECREVLISSFQIKCSTITVYSFLTMIVIFKLLYENYGCFNAGENTSISLPL